jgi:hypothetical protein
LETLVVPSNDMFNWICSAAPIINSYTMISRKVKPVFQKFVFTPILYIHCILISNTLCVILEMMQMCSWLCMNLLAQMEKTEDLSGICLFTLNEKRKRQLNWLQMPVFYTWQSEPYIWLFVISQTFLSNSM